MDDDRDFPLRVVACADTPAEARALRERLESAGAEVVAVVDCISLVRDAAPGAPHQFVCQLPRGGDLAPLLGLTPEHALSVIAPGIDAAQAAALGRAGADCWLELPAAAALPALLAAARERHRRESALRAEIAALRTQIDDRIWIDRAKGLLMAARSLDEDGAYKLLRGAAMDANLRLADVARSVVDAARRADAVNRAGQLRMLSQRLVAQAAQRLARIDAAGARRRQQEAVQRLLDNLDHLGGSGGSGGHGGSGLDADAAAALRDVTAAWESLRMALALRLDLTTLEAIDARAEDLLQAADRLTAALEAGGGARALAIVNLCGSQRMRTQRLVKKALLDRLAPRADRAEQLQLALTDYERVQQAIEAAPLTSPEIRAAQAEAREGWLALLRAQRAGDAAALAGAGEQQLRTLERLTEAVEHSLQVLLA
ncbi:MAG: ANTAR domain-containing protein [Burkholderiales bacterium]|nr:ANTAR domain-containing protein [Burkholderiales bacterium]